MAHYVICPKCGKRFDRDSVQSVKVGARRYGHADCYPDNHDYVPLVKSLKEDEDYISLMNFIKKTYKDNANYALIKKQIKQFTTENKYSLSGILKSLIYWYDVKGNSIDKSGGGLGIVPYIYQDAYNYYLALFLAQQANENKTLTTEVKEVVIKPPKKRGSKQQFFDLGEWEDEE